MSKVTFLSWHLRPASVAVVLAVVAVVGGSCLGVLAAFQNDTVYKQLQGWQSGIGALVGFAALLVGAGWNFELNRRRDDLLRIDEAQSIAAALFGEVLLLRRAVATVAKSVADAHIAQGTRRYARRFDKHFSDQYALPPTTFYVALADKIGLLPPQVVFDLAVFHSDISAVRTWLPRLEDDPTRGFGYSAGYVLQPAISAVESATVVLIALRMLANIAKPIEKKPSIGNALDVINWEHETAVGNEDD